ncbi:hypothetical protein [Streptomyces sp. B6B3]|uniref:hypothetical protein n=1 Tax=Streptomyces sp. B6B3 TaxID=3153570 RepID=UPI00325E0B94
MDQALDNRLDERLDKGTAQRTLVLFAVTCALAVLASPILVIYELLFGTLGLVAMGALSRFLPSGVAMTGTVVAAGVLAGSLPYLFAAAFVV